MHEHSWTWITGRMERLCQFGDWHEVDDPEWDFEVCWCGNVRNEKPYVCPDMEEL